MRIWPWIFLLPLAACGSGDAPTRPPDRPAGSAVEAVDVVAAVRRLPEFAKFATALETTGVADELAGMRAVTVLAPRDTAFAELPAGTLSALMDPGYAATLRGTLRGLAIARILRASELRTEIDAAGGTLLVPTLTGPPVSFTRQGDELYVTAASGLRAGMGTLEISARNGAVYVLDGWIAPAPAPIPTTPVQE